MNQAVLDTSVIFKWYHHFGEEDLDAALFLRDAYFNGVLSVHVPDLMIYEFSNSLRFKKQLVHDDVTASVRNLWSLGLNIHKVDLAMTELMISISFENGISVYDAAFVTLSRHIAATLVTADRNLYGKVKEDCAVILLSDVGGNS